eukprot:TRINITY_DN7110_c0_g2_i3.p1 TRINITY_DN7110_c0_g2~~TRINITY_DN7110_c0_g2_i3.p1  ORF type:complete len:303 (+),score=33.12 TRINITY_DN7110_c0_g2_i3:340-1248(+)
MQLLSDKKRLESLVWNMPKQSKRTEQVHKIINSQQRLMLDMIVNLEQSKQSAKEQKLRELNYRVATIEQQKRCINVLPVQYSAKTKQQAKMQLIKQEDLKAMKQNYLNDQAKKEQLMQAINLESEEEYKKKLDTYKKLKNTRLENTPFSAVDYLKKFKRKENWRIKFKAIAKVILAFLILKRTANEKVFRIKEKQQAHFDSMISLYTNVTRVWLLKVLQSALNSVFCPFIFNRSPITITCVWRRSSWCRCGRVCRYFWTCLCPTRLTEELRARCCSSCNYWLLLSSSFLQITYLPLKKQDSN